MPKVTIPLTANVHIHATHSHLTPLGEPHAHGVGTMLTYGQNHRPHHHCDNVCIKALEDEIERLNEVIINHLKVCNAQSNDS